VNGLHCVHFVILISIIRLNKLNHFLFWLFDTACFMTYNDKMYMTVYSGLVTFFNWKFGVSTGTCSFLWYKKFSFTDYRLQLSVFSAVILCFYKCLSLVIVLQILEIRILLWLLHYRYLRFAYYFGYCTTDTWDSHTTLFIVLQTLEIRILLWLLYYRYLRFAYYCILASESFISQFILL
jgi:hypothetical protein